MVVPRVETNESTIRYGSGRRPIREFHLTASRLRATVWDQGATLVGIEIPDGTNFVQARERDADFGSADPAGFMGSTIGRFANRIADARFVLDGVDYRLAANDGSHTLHGGPVGFDRRIWTSGILEEADRVGVRFGLQSSDGDQGFPGNLDVTVTYWLATDERLILEYEATCDAPTGTWR